MLVIDASATVYLLASKGGFAPRPNDELVAPTLLWSEVTSAITELAWRGQLSSDLAGRMFARLLDAPIQRRANAQLYRHAQQVAQELGWAKTYDAEYVALAQELEARLVSRDERLRRGVRGVVEIVGPDEVGLGG